MQYTALTLNKLKLSFLHLEKSSASHAEGKHTAKTDNQWAVAAQQKAELERLRAELVEDGFKGLAALADCEHEVAIAYARTAARSDNENYSLAGLWIEVLTFGDRGEADRARALYPSLVARDPQIGSEAQAEETMRKSLQQLQDIRAKYDLPRGSAPNQTN